MPARLVTAGGVGLACLAAFLVTSPASAQSYPPPAPAAAVEVRLPAGAELWFDGVATTQAGDRREFMTPPLNPGLTYSYEVVVRWREGGQDVVRSERALVRAGEAVVVDFTQAREQDGGPDHMAVREIAPAGNHARVVPAAHDSLVELAARSAITRRLPGYMAVVEVAPPSGDGGATRPAPAVPGHMSIVEFDPPQR